MNSKPTQNSFYARLKSLNDPDPYIFGSEKTKEVTGRVLAGIGAILFFLTTYGFLPDQMDAILHREMLLLGALIGILGLLLISRLIAYILISFLIIVQIIAAIDIYYHAYPF